MNAGAWDALRAIAADPAINAQRPNVGTVVRVIEGKHLGTEGRVTWHGRDRFDRSGRYGDAMTHHLRDLRGQYGFRVRVQPTDGAEAFFVGADKVCVL